MAYYNLDSPPAPRSVDAMAGMAGSSGKARRQIRRTEKIRRRERLRALMQRGRISPYRSASWWGLAAAVVVCAAVGAGMMMSELIDHAPVVPLIAGLMAGAFVFASRLGRLKALQPTEFAEGVLAPDGDPDPADQPSPEPAPADKPGNDPGPVRTVLTDEEKALRRLRMSRHRRGTDARITAAVTFLVLTGLGWAIAMFAGGRPTGDELWIGLTVQQLSLIGLAAGVVLGTIAAIAILMGERGYIPPDPDAARAVAESLADPAPDAGQ